MLPTTTTTTARNYCARQLCDTVLCLQEDRSSRFSTIPRDVLSRVLEPYVIGALYSVPSFAWLGDSERVASAAVTIHSGDYRRLTRYYNNLTVDRHSNRVIVASNKDSSLHPTAPTAMHCYRDGVFLGSQELVISDCSQRCRLLVSLHDARLFCIENMCIYTRDGTLQTNIAASIRMAFAAAFDDDDACDVLDISTKHGTTHPHSNELVLLVRNVRSHSSALMFVSWDGVVSCVCRITCETAAVVPQCLAVNAITSEVVICMKLYDNAQPFTFILAYFMDTELRNCNALSSETAGNLRYYTPFTSYKRGISPLPNSLYEPGIFIDDDGGVLLTCSGYYCTLVYVPRDRAVDVTYSVPSFKDTRVTLHITTDLRELVRPQHCEAFSRAFRWEGHATTVDAYGRVCMFDDCHAVIIGPGALKSQ
jgi:hypothetical protein